MKHVTCILMILSLSAAALRCGACGGAEAPRDGAASQAEQKNKEAKWEGVDKTVIEKYAEAAGRPPREPFINTDQGDLLLFCFLIAGAIAGFIAGYLFRALFPPGPKKASAEASPGSGNVSTGFGIDGGAPGSGNGPGSVGGAADHGASANLRQIVP